MNTSLNEHNFTAKALENYFGFSKKYKPIEKRWEKTTIKNSIIRAMNVPMAAPRTPISGKPNFPKINT